MSDTTPFNRASGRWSLPVLLSMLLGLLILMSLAKDRLYVAALGVGGMPGSNHSRAAKDFHGDVEMGTAEDTDSRALPTHAQDPSRPTSSMYGVSQHECTRAFLDAFPAALPGLRALWDGEDFCAWPGVLCTLQGVHVDVSARRLSGRLPELSDLVDGSMVVLLSINLSANRDLRGTLPVSWAGLDTVAYINVASTGLSGTIPRAWYSMDALRTVDITDTRVASKVAIPAA